jgi:hypothetical protein
MIESSYSLTFAGLTYGLGDIGTPGEHGSFSLAPSPVPLPAAAWLFITGVLVMLKMIPKKYKVIPAQAVISKHSGSIRPEVDPHPKSRGVPA